MIQRRQFFVAYYGRRMRDGESVSGMNLTREAWDRRRPLLSAEGFELVAVHYSSVVEESPESYQRILGTAVKALGPGS